MVVRIDRVEEAGEAGPQCWTPVLDPSAGPQCWAPVLGPSAGPPAPASVTTRTSVPHALTPTHSHRQFPGFGSHRPRRRLAGEPGGIVTQPARGSSHESRDRREPYDDGRAGPAPARLPGVTFRCSHAAAGCSVTVTVLKSGWTCTRMASI